MSARSGGPKRPRRKRRSDERRAIYLLPNLFTTTSLLLGFWSIVQASQGHFNAAALGIVGAGICDMLDGWVARATRSASRFGVEYDSLADVVSFGVAPAFLLWSWTLAPLGRRGWVVAALFAVCTALRLARFNVQQQQVQKTGYRGLPSPIAGGFVAASIWFLGWLGLEPPLPRMVGAAVTAGFAGLALLMVSSLPYFSLKGSRLAGRHPFPVLVGAIVGLVVILLHHEPVLFGLGLLYILSGPGLWLMEYRARGERPEIEAASSRESQSDVQ
jgi:CDP-diacylglycerol--serine O-phosphatidyltransferase